MSALNRFWKTTLNPDRYHGHGKKPPFFEGWYFKLVDPSTEHRWAIIPGIFLSGDPHTFVQILDGSSGASYYHTYDVSDFEAADDRFAVRIGPNRFSRDAISLDIARPEQTVQGVLSFDGPTPWPVTVTAPGIMGWYAWVPFMECYHGVVSLDHAIHGGLEIDGEAVDFSGGRGYIEKDWGRSFPSSWIWLQSNHFDTVGTSLTGSIAMIPWVRRAFRGFIVGLWHRGQLYRFATYTGARTDLLRVTDGGVEWVLSDARHRLEIEARRGRGGVLKGPTTHDMGKRVAESLDATVNVALFKRERGGDEPIFAGTGGCAGLEIFNAGDPAFIPQT